MSSLPIKSIQAAHMSLYPSHDSLIEAVQYIEAQAPIEPHEVFPLLMRYHNSLIAELAKSGESNVIPLRHTSGQRKAP